MCSKYLSQNKSKAKTRGQNSNINHKKLQPKKHLILLLQIKASIQ